MQACAIHTTFISGALTTLPIDFNTSPLPLSNAPPTAFAPTKKGSIIHPDFIQTGNSVVVLAAAWCGGGREEMRNVFVVSVGMPEYHVHKVDYGGGRLCGTYVAAPVKPTGLTLHDRH